MNVTLSSRTDSWCDLFLYPPAWCALQVHADYSQLGTLIIVQILLGLALPFGAVLLARLSKFRSA